MLITIAEAAELLAVSKRTIDREIKAGELPYVRVRGSVRLDRSDIDDYISRKKVRREQLDHGARLGSIASGYHFAHKSAPKGDAREALALALERLRR